MNDIIKALEDIYRKLSCSGFGISVFMKFQNRMPAFHRLHLRFINYSWLKNGNPRHNLRG
jgi:hypothetical protein